MTINQIVLLSSRRGSDIHKSLIVNGGMCKYSSAPWDVDTDGSDGEMLRM